MTHKTSRAISIFIVISIFAATILLISCTTTEETYLLRMKFDPVNKVIHSRQESHRVGSMYKAGNWFEDFEKTITGEISITVIEIFTCSASALFKGLKMT